MAVDPAVSRIHMEQELAAMSDYAVSCHWEITPDLEHLSVRVKMRAHNDDLFIVEIHCDDYKELPPLVDFIDPNTGASGTRHAYPRTSDSLFHDSGPCMCAPCSRKAYKSFFGTGPHSDWSPGNWTQSTANNTPWVNYSTLGGILGLIYKRLISPEHYKGRMG